MRRREFLGLSAVAGLAGKSRQVEESMLASATVAQTPRVGIVLSSFAGGQEHDGTPLKGLAHPQAVDQPLAAARLAAMLDKALSLGTEVRGGLERMVAPEDWVVVKVRVGGEQPGGITDPRLVRSLVEWLVARRCGKRFSIAESLPAGISWAQPAKDFEGVTYAEVAAGLKRKYPRVRVELVNLAEDAYLEVPANTRTYAKGNPEGVYAIARTIRECDKLISVAPLAVDEEFGVGACLANYRGIARRAQVGEAEDVLTDLYLHHPADYAIAGGSWALEGEGGKAVSIRHNLLVAGRNAVSVDAVAAAVMGFDERALELLDRLERRGFGVRDTDAIWTRGNEIEEARRDFVKPARWRKS